MMLVVETHMEDRWDCKMAFVFGQFPNRSRVGKVQRRPT